MVNSLDMVTSKGCMLKHMLHFSVPVFYILSWFTVSEYISCNSIHSLHCHICFGFSCVNTLTFLGICT